MIRLKFFRFAFWLTGLLVSNQVLSQCSDEWVKQVSGLPTGNLANSSPSLVVDYQGNVIVSNVIVGADTILTDGEIFPETYSFTPNSDFFIAKYSNEGNLLWLKTIIGERDCGSLDIDTDGDGNIYVGGIMQNSINVDGTLIARPQESLPQPGYFILKFNSLGQLQWFHKGDWKSSRCYSLAWTGTDLAFVLPYSDSISIDSEVFYSDDTTSSQDMVFGRLDTDGNLINAVNIGGEGNVEVNELACDTNGCLLQGRFDQELSFDGTTVSTPSELHFELYQMSINSNYGLDWINYSQSSTGIDPRGYGLDLTDNGAVYFAGFYRNSAFTLESQQLPSPAQTDVFMGKLNRSDGSVVWLKKGSGSSFETSRCLATSAGFVWAGGEFYSETFEYEGTSFTNTTDGENDGFLFSLDADGKPKCSLQLEGFGQNGILRVDGFGDVQIAILGYFNGTLEFGGQTYEALGNYDLLVVKTCLECDSITGINELEHSFISSLTTSPNPAKEHVDVSYLTKGKGQLTIQLTDMYGKTLKSLKVSDDAGQIRLNLTDLSGGVYFCTLRQDGNILTTRKLIRQK